MVNSFRTSTTLIGLYAGRRWHVLSLSMGICRCYCQFSKKILAYQELFCIVTPLHNDDDEGNEKINIKKQQV